MTILSAMAIHNLKESDLPFPVKFQWNQTGHMYIYPKNNLNPFTPDQEEKIKEVLTSLGIGFIKNKVLANYTTKEIPAGYGFRVYQL